MVEPNPTAIATYAPQGERVAAPWPQRAAEAASEGTRVVEAKAAFLANVTHELRTPLTAILGYAHLLARDPSLGADAKRMVSILRRSGEHLLDLVNDVLELSEIEAGRVSLVPEAFCVRRLLEEVESALRPGMQAKGLSLAVVKGDGCPGFMVADRAKVRRVLVSVLEDALRSTPAGEITLRVSAVPVASGLRASATVERTAAGDDEEPATPRERSGQPELRPRATLALAICSGYARRMGGEFEVESEPGGGPAARFEFMARDPLRLGGEVPGDLGAEHLHERRAPGGEGAGDPLASVDAASLPPEAVHAMRDALWSGDLDRLRCVLAGLEGDAGRGAAALRGLADRFDYEALHRALGTGRGPR